MNKRIFAVIFSAAGILLLILDAKTALQGAAEGITLCLYTVVPSQLPFFVLSMLLTGSLMGSQIPLLRPLGTILGIPKGCESLLITGILGGYPTGAQAVAQNWQSGYLDADNASRMTVICNLAGPAFLFGIVGNQFSTGSVAWMLWIIHILSAFITAALLPKTIQQFASVRRATPISVTEAVSRSVRVMATVCGWIVLFRVILAFLSRWFLWMLPVSLRVLAFGLLELANGCCALHQIPHEGLRFVLASAMLSFGGLCVSMQTASVTSGLDFRGYIPGKLLQTVISVILALFIQSFVFASSEQLAVFPLIAPLLLSVLWMGVKFLRKQKNNSRIFPAVGV